VRGTPTTRNLYLELTALLIDREIGKFRRGEQAALVSFTNVAELARNATREAAREPCPRPDASGHGGRGGIASHRYLVQYVCKMEKKGGSPS
jgi:hypothetical protein